jgi:hypothetical protein
MLANEKEESGPSVRREDFKRSEKRLGEVYNGKHEISFCK